MSEWSVGNWRRVREIVKTFRPNLKTGKRDVMRMHRAALSTLTGLGSLALTDLAPGDRRRLTRMTGGE